MIRSIRGFRCSRWKAIRALTVSPLEMPPEAAGHARRRCLRRRTGRSIRSGRKQTRACQRLPLTRGPNPLRGVDDVPRMARAAPPPRDEAQPPLPPEGALPPQGALRRVPVPARQRSAGSAAIPSAVVSSAVVSSAVVSSAVVSSAIVASAAAGSTAASAARGRQFRRQPIRPVRTKSCKSFMARIAGRRSRSERTTCPPRACDSCRRFAAGYCRCA